ncbi:MAG: LysR family transcriptional regulator [Pseudomonadota bacterium]
MTGAAKTDGIGAKRDAPGVRVKIYVRDDMIGGGKVELLDLLRTCGSVDAAARAMGIDHERAWFLLETLQRCFAAPLFTARRGEEAEAAEVTPLGRDLINRFAKHKKAVDALSAEFVDWLAERQRVAEDG